MIITDNLLLHSLALADFPVGGTVTTAQIDAYAQINIAQTTANQTVALGTPTSTNGCLTLIVNTGTVALTVEGVHIHSQEGSLFSFVTPNWIPITGTPTPDKATILLTTGAPTATLNGVGIITIAIPTFISLVNRSYLVIVNGTIRSNVANANIGFDVLVDGVLTGSSDIFDGEFNIRKTLNVIGLAQGLAAGIHTITLRTRGAQAAITLGVDRFSITLLEVAV